MAGKPARRVSVRVIPAAVSSPRMAKIAGKLMESRAFNEWMFKRPNYGAPLSTRLNLGAVQAIAFQFMIQVWAYAEQNGIGDGKYTLFVADCMPNMPDHETGVEGFGDILIELGDMEVVDGGLRFPHFGTGIAINGAAQRSQKHRQKKRDQAAGKVQTEDDRKGFHQKAVELWCKKWEGRWGEKYAFQGFKDGSHIKWLLSATQWDLVKLSEVIDRYLADTEPFYLEKHHPLGMLKAGFTKWQFGEWNGRTHRVGGAGRASAEAGKYTHLDPAREDTAPHVEGSVGYGGAGNGSQSPAPPPADSRRPSLFD